jgi:hypothetical protein
MNAHTRPFNPCLFALLLLLTSQSKLRALSQAEDQMFRLAALRGLQEATAVL